MTQNNLGTTLSELGIRAGGEEGLGYLKEAIKVFDDALSVFDAANFPEYHRMALSNKGKAMQRMKALK